MRKKAFKVYLNLKMYCCQIYMFKKIISYFYFFLVYVDC